MVYVDTLAEAKWKWGKSCHLFADSIDELHEFARAIGLKREWFQKGFPHYDLTTAMRKKAVSAGAQEVSRKYTAIRRLYGNR